MTNDTIVLMDSAHIVVDDQYLHYLYTKAQKAKATIIFLHGWGSNSDTWKYLMGKLVNEEFNCFAVDFSGFGSSERPKKPFFISDYSRLLKSFIQKKVTGKIILVCHSFGARVGVKLISQNPTLIDRLVLIDSAGIQEISITRKIIKQAASFFTPIFNIFSFPFLKKKVYNLLRADYLSTPSELKETFLNIISEDQSTEFSKIQCETLIMWGENDIDTPISMAKKIKNLISKSKLVMIKDAGHFSYLDQPVKTLDEIKNFIL